MSFTILKKYILILTAATAILSCKKQEPYSPAPKKEDKIEISEGTTIYGLVSCDGKGVPGVVVSDGIIVTTTDSEGVYQIASQKKHGYVFISIPSGYESESYGVQPRFFHMVENNSNKVERADFKLFKTDQSECTVLFFGDIHLANRTFCHDISQFREFTADVNDFIASNGRRTYAVTLGDMTWDVFWNSNKYDLTSYLAEVNADFRNLQIFHTMGNHDNDPTLAGDFLGENAYKCILGPTYYSFNISGIHYIVLDDIIYRNETGERDFYRQVSDEQIAWMVEDLKYVSRQTPVFVAMHCPLYTDTGGSSLSGLWNLIKHFEGYDHIHFVTGHTHAMYNVDCLNRSVPVFENNSGAVCGAWWMTGLNRPGTHIGPDGAPGGYRVFQVKGSSFDWQYKGTGLPLETQFRASHQGNGVVYINIWDYDPLWEISVTEGGKPLNVSRLTDVKDPLYLEVYEKYETDHGYSVSYPAYETNHIFSVTASSPDSEISITVTDRFGRKYSDTFRISSQS